MGFSFTTYLCIWLVNENLCSKGVAMQSAGGNLLDGVGRRQTGLLRLVSSHAGSLELTSDPHYSPSRAIAT